MPPARLVGGCRRGEGQRCGSDEDPQRRVLQRVDHEGEEVGRRHGRGGVGAEALARRGDARRVLADYRVHAQIAQHGGRAAEANEGRQVAGGAEAWRRGIVWVSNTQRETRGRALKEDAPASCSSLSGAGGASWSAACGGRPTGHLATLPPQPSRPRAADAERRAHAVVDGASSIAAG